MKITFERRRGSILTMILITIVLMGITLGSYLSLVSNQNKSITRSQQWNAGIPLAEAGIEEAMAHLNKNLTNRSADGWTSEGTNVVKERKLGQDKYIVMINKDVDPPLVMAEAFVYMPNEGKFIEPPRRIRVATTNDGLFSKAMVAKGPIELSGNTLQTDSFDSSDPKYSGPGGSYDPDKNKDNGDIATNSSLTDSLDVWNAKVMGHVATGPGGTVKIGPNGKIGDKAWFAKTENKGLKPGWSSDDMNVQFPNVTVPFSGAFPLVLSTVAVDGTNYLAAPVTGNYELDSLTLSGNEKLLIRGDVKLHIKGGLDISGNAFIFIAPNASLQLYVSGASANIAGNGIANGSAKAQNLGYWGLPSNTSVAMHGNAAFTGTIYAPQADLVLGGGGSGSHDFAGASVSETVTMNGHFQFHYDEALGKFGPRRGYTIVSWSEGGWPGS